MKKKTALFLAFVMFILGINITGLAYVVDYSEGPTTYNVSLAEYTYGSGVSVNENGELLMSAGGCVEYSFYLPFEAQNADIVYTIDKPVNLEYDFGTVSGVKNASASSSYVTVKFQKAKSAGDEKVILKADGDIKIRKITFKKVKKPVCISAEIGTVDLDSRPLPNLSAFQDAVQTAVILNPESPVMMVNGAKRYVDYDDVSKKPLERDGVTYLPIKAFGEAVGYYTEEIYDEGYALLRKNRFEYVLKDGNLYRQTNGVGYSQMQNILLRENGTTYIPVRYFSEIVGKKVVYKDGFTFIENSRHLIDEITETGIFDELKSKFAEFMVTQPGKTYYVSGADNASDENDGSEERPWRTLAKAGDTAQAGDTVIIRGGVYREILAPKNSGTAASPIVFRAADGENVVISALEDVSVTPVFENDLYVYDMGYTMGDGRNQVFVDGEAIREGRHPNSNTSPRKWPEDIGLSPLWPTIGNIQVRCDDKIGEKSDTATSTTDLEQPTDFWKGGTLVSFHGPAWALGMAKITGSDNGIVYLDLGTATKNWWFTWNPHDTDFAFITDCKNTIDMPGEWYWDDEDKKLYIMMPDGKTPETINMEVKKRQLTVDISENSYVQVVGINTIGGGMKLNHSNMCVINGGNHKYVSHYTYSMDQHYACIEDANVVNKDAAPYRGEMGIFLGGTDNAIINTNIKYSAAAGIYSSGLYSYIYNNELNECGYMVSYTGGLFMVGNPSEELVDTPRGGHAIYYNTFKRSGRGVFQISAVEDVWFYSDGQAPHLAMDIAYNSFSEGSICARDTGTVYIHGVVLGSDRAKTQFHHNMVSNPWALDGGCAGLYWDNWVHGVDSYNNVIFSNNGIKMNMGDIYTQDVYHFADTYATVPAWSNSMMGQIEKEPDDFLETDFPNSKRFYAGKKTEEPYRVNFDNIEIDRKVYFAKDAKLSDKAEIVNGFVDLKADGEWICFENVEFGDKFNSFELSYIGNSVNTGDAVDVIVGDSLADEVDISVLLSLESPVDNDVATVPIIVPGCEGTKNVYIRCTGYRSAAIGGIAPVKVGPEAFNDIVYGQTYMGNASETIGGELMTKAGPIIQEDKFLIYNTFGPATAVYKDVVLNTDVNTFAINSAVGENYNQTVQVRIGSPDSEVVAEIKVTSTDWADYTTDIIPLTKTIEAGVYDVYITFVEARKSINAWWFGFQNRQ